MLLTTPMHTRRLPDALEALALRHDRLCPRQVLGVRMGLRALEVLGVEYDPARRSVLAFVETDGCFVSGIEVATGCSVGHRTLHVRDYGKVAATFVEVTSGRAFRLAPRPDVRERASAYSDDERRYYAQLEGYQAMPDEELLELRPVRLSEDLEALLGRRGVRVVCTGCGEEVMNGREVVLDDAVRCRGCAEGSYCESPRLPASRRA